MPAQSTDAARRQAGVCSLRGSTQPMLANDIRERLNKLRLRLAARSASIMEVAEAGERDGTLGGVIDNDWMDEAGGGFVHVPKSFQCAIPFPNKDAFSAFVGVCGNHWNKDVASGDVLL